MKHLESKSLISDNTEIGNLHDGEHMFPCTLVLESEEDLNDKMDEDESVVMKMRFNMEKVQAFKETKEKVWTK